MKKLAFLLAALLLLAGCGASGSAQPAQTGSVDTAQTDGNTPSETAEPLVFEAQTLDGETVDETVFANAKLTMLNIWATFCGPCINEMPELGELAAESDGSYQIIGLCIDLDGSDEMLDEARAIVSETGAAYLHLQPADSLASILDGVDAVPTTFFFDSEGREVGKFTLGARDKAAWSAELADRLAQVDAHA